MEATQLYLPNAQSTSSHDDTSSHPLPMRRRASDIGERHGLALGNTAVAVVAYGSGFASGFTKAFDAK